MFTLPNLSKCKKIVNTKLHRTSAWQKWVQLLHYLIQGVIDASDYYAAWTELDCEGRLPQIYLLPSTPMIASTLTVTASSLLTATMLPWPSLFSVMCQRLSHSTIGSVWQPLRAPLHPCQALPLGPLLYPGITHVQPLYPANQRLDLILCIRFCIYLQNIKKEK